MNTDPNNSWQIFEMMDVPIFLHDSQFFAFAKMLNESGKQLDSKVVDVALRLFEGKASLDTLGLDDHF